MSFPGPFDAIEFFADEELGETCEDRFIGISFDFATILASSFWFLHPLRHRFGAANQAGILNAANRAEMADIEHIERTVPFITCKITFGQNVCELMFDVDGT